MYSQKVTSELFCNPRNEKQIIKLHCNMLLWSHKIYGGYITEVESKNQMQLFSLWEFFSQYHANSDNLKKIVTSI